MGGREPASASRNRLQPDHVERLSVQGDVTCEQLLVPGRCLVLVEYRHPSLGKYLLPSAPSQIEVAKMDGVVLSRRPKSSSPYLAY